VVSFTRRPLYPQHPLDRRLIGPQSQSGHGGEEKISQPLPGFEPPIFQFIAQSYITELSWLPRVSEYGLESSCLREEPVASSIKCKLPCSFLSTTPLYGVVLRNVESITKRIHFRIILQLRSTRLRFEI
jgi:hypothetical protein